jgi:hypothetical protein
LVWSTLVFVNGFGIGLTAYMWQLYMKTKAENDALEMTGNDTGVYNEKMLLALAIIMSIVVGGVLLLTISLRNRISLAIEIIEEAAE